MTLKTKEFPRVNKLAKDAANDGGYLVNEAKVRTNELTVGRMKYVMTKRAL